MQAIRWRVSRLLMPWQDDDPPLLEITAVATWEEMASSEKVMPSVAFQFWLPAQQFRDSTLTEVERAAYRYIRDHLQPVLSSLPPDQT